MQQIIFFYCLVRCSSTTRELMWMNCLIVLLFSWIKWTYASHLSRFVSIFMSVVSFMKVVRLPPNILFYLSGLWYRAIMNRQQLPKKPVAVFNSSMFVPFITAGIVCLFPTNSWHLLVNPLGYAYFSLILMDVPEGERRVICKKSSWKSGGILWIVFCRVCFTDPFQFIWEICCCFSRTTYRWDTKCSIWSPLFSRLPEQCGEFPNDWQKISKWNNA